MARQIQDMNSEEREKMENEIKDVIVDFLFEGADENIFPATEKIEEIRVKYDITKFEMSLYMGAFLSVVLDVLESRER